MDSAAYARRQVTIRKSDPELCKNCGAPLTQTDQVNGCPQTWCLKCIAYEREPVAVDAPLSNEHRYRNGCLRGDEIP